MIESKSFLDMCFRKQPIFLKIIDQRMDNNKDLKNGQGNYQYKNSGI